MHDLPGSSVLGQLHFSVSATYNIHSLFCRLSLTPFHISCYLWGSPHGSSMVSMPVSPLQPRLHRHPWPPDLSHASQTVLHYSMLQLPSAAPSIMGFLCNWGWTFINGLSPMLSPSPRSLQFCSFRAIKTSTDPFRSKHSIAFVNQLLSQSSPRSVWSGMSQQDPTPVTNFCINYFSVYVLQHHGQKRVLEEWIHFGLQFM